MIARRSKKMEKHGRTTRTLLLFITIWLIDICTATFEDLFARNVIEESTTLWNHPGGTTHYDDQNSWKDGNYSTFYSAASFPQTCTTLEGYLQWKRDNVLDSDDQYLMNSIGKFDLGNVRAIEDVLIIVPEYEAGHARDLYTQQISLMYKD